MIYKRCKSANLAPQLTNPSIGTTFRQPIELRGKFSPLSPFDLYKKDYIYIFEHI